jgi:uncharacterized protein (DUF3084 family)
MKTLFTLYLITLSLASPSHAFAKKPEWVPKKNQPTISREPREDGLMRSCAAREETLTTRMTRLTNLATTMMTKFDGHVERIEKYYTTKILPKGAELSNYESLLDDIEDKKAAVQSALADAQTDADAFTCESDDPKSNLQQFRKNMQTVKQTLQDYRTSIKDLIIAINSIKVTPTP